MKTSLLLFITTLPFPVFAQDAMSIGQLLTGSKDPLVRESAAQVLGNRGDLGAAGLLQRRMKDDKNLWVRASCADALGRMGALSAIKALRSALGREKNQRVRRAVSQALVRLGQRKGINDLMWQLKSGTNHTRAEVMRFLVGITGQPLGQDAEAWWRHFRKGGYRFLEQQRPAGSSAVLELAGAGKRNTPRLWANSAPAWQQVPASVLRLPACQTPITEEMLVKHEKTNGAIPDGVLLLLQTRTAKNKKPAVPKTTPHCPMPGLTLGAARYIFKRAPGMLGLAVDTRALDPPGVSGHPVRALLLAKKRLVLEGISGMNRLPSTGARLLLVRLGKARVRVLAILP